MNNSIYGVIRDNKVYMHSHVLFSFGTNNLNNIFIKWQSNKSLIFNIYDNINNFKLLKIPIKVDNICIKE